MCGISCILALDERTQQHGPRNKDNIETKLNASLAQIKHRGPDSSGTWVSEDCRIALGHARLEINDLSITGHQPLHSTDGVIHAVVNGEIYDYPHHRKEMEEKIGYKFQGTSDCEVVLPLYKYYGLSFLSKIRGEFSICLFDSERQLFVAVRDRYGIKPLFWLVQNGELLVAAEMKAFLPLGWQPEWDVKSIVGGDRQISNCTIFKNVQKVRPGHYLTCRNFGVINERMYWESEYPDKNIKEDRTEEEMIQGVRNRMLDAIRERLRADVKVGVSLSGGIDSSVVAGMVNHLQREGHHVGSEAENERLSCFGIAFDEDTGFDESAIANRTAEFLNVKFYKKHMSEQELVNNFEDATWHCEGASNDLNFIGTYALSDLFREKGYTININGQGSDEIFGGYNIFLPDFLREPDNTFPVSDLTPSQLEDELNKSESYLTTSRPESSKATDIFAGRITLDAPTSARRQLNNILTPNQMTCAYPALPVKSSFLPRTRLSIEQTYAESIPVTTLTKIQSKWHPLHSAQYMFTTGHLPNLILSYLGDRGEMAHSIEGRTPFLDHHLTEYVNGLPPSMKIRQHPDSKQWVEKYVLREAARPFITDELYTRRKHPYSAPVAYPVGGPMYWLLKRLVTVENLDQLGWMDTSNVGGLVDEAFESKDQLRFRLVSELAQWVVLHQRFGVRRAVPEGGEERLL